METAKRCLRMLLVDVDSSTPSGRSMQRFRLVGLPSVPVAIVVAVCAWQLIGYRRTLAGYRGMYDRAQFRYLMAQLVAKIDNERAAVARDFLILNDDEDRRRMKSCVNRSNEEIVRTIRDTNEVLETFLRLPYIPSEEDLQSQRSSEFKNLHNSSAFKFYMTNLRSLIMNTGSSDCRAKYDLLLFVYTIAIRQSILISPSFYDAELSKVTFVHVFALQHALESHQHSSALCHLARSRLERGRFDVQRDEFDFVGNASAARLARRLALSADESILRLHVRLLENRSFPIREFDEAVDSIVRGERARTNFSDWYSMCRHVARFNELFEIELSNEIKRNGFDLEWRNCVTGIVLYSLAVFVNVPALALIFASSEATIGALRQFASLFQSQVDKLLEEKLRSEALLCAMLPRSVVARMAMGVPAEAETFESSTVFFSDVVDFNESISAHLEPIQVVDLLNSLYNLLDSKIDCFDVYKVETIGSVYMVVSGVPVRNGQSHVTEVADMSLGLLEAMNERNFPGIRGKVELRIGVHTGPCVAGVVGNKMTRYCLFGDTVNTASRMQSTGTASRIHLSESTFSELYLTQNYILGKRGTVDVKGKGAMTTYWLFGKRCS